MNGEIYLRQQTRTQNLFNMKTRLFDPRVATVRWKQLKSASNQEMVAVLYLVSWNNIK